MGGKRERGVREDMSDEAMQPSNEEPSASNLRIRDKDGLTQRQRDWVDTIVDEGISNIAAARRVCRTTEHAAKSFAARQPRLPHVQAYMQKRIMDSIGIAALRSVNTLNRLAAGAKSEYVQLEASKDVLDRAGFKPIDRSQVQVAGDIKVVIDLG